MDTKILNNVMSQDLVKTIGAVTQAICPVISFKETKLPQEGLEHMKGLYNDVSCDRLRLP